MSNKSFISNSTRIIQYRKNLHIGMYVTYIDLICQTKNQILSALI